MGRSPRPASRKGSTSPGAAGESGGGLLPCNECGKQFASPRSLAAHAKNHNNPLNGSEIQVIIINIPYLRKIIFYLDSLQTNLFLNIYPFILLEE